MEELYLVHHGIKGQKWGIRRFQNPDGTLTEAGKKKYYVRDGRGNLQKLSSSGRSYNIKQKKQYENAKKEIAKNIENNEEFKKYKDQYLELNKKNNEHYISEQKKWLSQEAEYKNKDYYDFKNISAEKWFSTNEGQLELETMNHIKNMIEESAKTHPLYNSPIKTLTEYTTSDNNSPYILQETGKLIVNQLFYDLVKNEAIKNQK